MPANSTVESTLKYLYEMFSLSAFTALMDNYNPIEGSPEHITEQEVAEDNHFLDLVMASDCMKATHAMLVSKGKASQDPAEFRQKLQTLWFGPYSRKSSSK